MLPCFFSPQLLFLFSLLHYQLKLQEEFPSILFRFRHQKHLKNPNGLLFCNKLTQNCMQYIQSLHQNHICLDMKQSSLIENWLQNLSIFDLDSANGSNLEGKHFRLGDKILNFVFPAVMAFEFQITMYFCHDVVTSATKKN